MIFGPQLTIDNTSQFLSLLFESFLKKGNPNLTDSSRCKQPLFLALSLDKNVKSKA